VLITSFGTGVTQSALFTYKQMTGPVRGLNWSNKSMRKQALIFMAALVLTGSSAAASLRNGDLPEGSNWYLHINVDLMRTSVIGQKMMEETVNEAFADIEKEIGVDFTQNITGLTVFGGQLPPNEGAVIAHGDLSGQVRNDLLDVMSKAGTFLEFEHAGYLYYGINDLGGDGNTISYTDEKGNRVVEEYDHGGDSDLLLVAFGDGQTMFAKSDEMVKRFLDSGARLAGIAAGPDELFVIEADRAMMQGGVNTTVNLGHGNWDSSILSNVERIAAVLVDENGAASFHADVTATSPEIAESVRNIVEGLVALKALDSSDEPAVGNLLRATKIATNGADITVDLYLEAALINDLLDL
jgi:phosphohistidine swiveling domain-containing protein